MNFFLPISARDCESCLPVPEGAKVRTMIAIWARAEVDAGRMAVHNRGRKEGAEVEEAGMIRIVCEDGAGPAGDPDSSE